ncbi:bifunctional riboflavin kinase/FAD synthetase [Phocaeicola barnesiae]|uniref:bifunctional riboflavin kinase/FAD synthetase n=1 Tax=Phocaeicola barnesiae TaxID=376804 RepID=UPI00266E9AF5|nr:bifunctional riboflavin kinase/FAD synthetase [Phocaeicola barnesiae]
MRIITDTDRTEALEPCVATIGCFDGVHRGHRYLINQVCEVAAEKGLHAAIVTFPVHPRQVMQTDYQPQLLSCLHQKTDLISQLDADYCFMLPFTRELSQLSAREFMQVLQKHYHIQVLVIGYDHRFGHNRSEGFEDYCRYGQELGMEVIRAKALVEDGVSISSSHIRSLLKQGAVHEANRCLGYEYYLDGTVTDGYKVGRKLGFPTANLLPACPEKLIPAEGVYAVYTYVQGIRYGGMLNIGHRPTVNNGTNLSIEVNILDFSENIYRKQMRIEFIAFIRSEQRFDSLEQLTAQLKADREQVRKLLQMPVR